MFKRYADKPQSDADGEEVYEPGSVLRQPPKQLSGKQLPRFSGHEYF